MNSTGLETSGMITGFYSYMQNISAEFFFLSTIKKKKIPSFVIFGLVYLFYNAKK